MIATFLYALAGMVQAAPAAPAQTLQARFDAANAAFGASDCTTAIPLYEALERSPAANRNALFAGAIAVRKGLCLTRTGKPDDGLVAMRRGVPMLTTKRDEFATDLREAYLAMGNSASARFDYDPAAAAYADALAVSKGQDRLPPLLGLARVLAFDRDGKALAYAAEARALALADPTLVKANVALVQTRYARVLLNEGRHKEAYAELKDSLRKQGGLDLSVSASDVATRGDLALAALLTGDRDQARTYLAYTGAGRMKDSPFARASDMTPPVCGATSGLKREDVAVVEFALIENGAVANATPIYTTGGREVALAFARAVADWSWTPADAAAIPAFSRQAVRVELRCTVAGERPPITAPIEEAVEAWLASQQGAAPSWANETSARALPLVQAEVARARTAGDRPALMAALVWLGRSSLITGPERAAALAEARQLAVAAGAPVAVQTWFSLESTGTDWDRRDSWDRDREALLAMPAVAADPLSAATIRMVIATNAPLRKHAETEALLTKVIDSPLPDRHPLKITALLRRADLLAAQGQVDAARASFDRTGLTGDQCALIAPKPVVKRLGASSSDFPQEALQMGFEGWAQTEFDIAPDGRTVAPRTIAAYPPFVFGDAASRMAKDVRFQSSYRPDGNVACIANKLTIAFRLP